MNSIKNIFSKKKIICTHDGKFHADDVFAVATLSIFFNDNIKIIRSRDPEKIKNSFIVVDNGREYSLEKNIFDHHQAGGAGERENNIPYASFGLIWKHFGLEICKRMNAGQKVWEKIDQDFVAQIDASDTGYEDFYIPKIKQSAFVLDKIISLFVPTWREDFKDVDKNFSKMIPVAKEIIKRLIITNRDKELSNERVLEIYNKSQDKRFIFLDNYYPWSVLIEKPEPLFVIFPEANSSRYKIQGVPVIKDSYELRKKLPDDWCGLSDKDLEQKSKINGFVFCHNNGFLGVVNSIDVAKEVISKVLE